MPRQSTRSRCLAANGSGTHALPAVTGIVHSFCRKVPFLIASFLVGCTATDAVDVSKRDAATDIGRDVNPVDQNLVTPHGGSTGVIGTGGVSGQGAGGTRGMTMHTGGTFASTSGTGGLLTQFGGAGGTKTAAGGAGGTLTKAGGAGGTKTAAGGTGGSLTGRGGSADAATEPTSSVLAKLKEYLAVPRVQRKSIETESFSQTPLGREEAAQAAELLWQDHAENIRTTRKAEHDARKISLEGKTLRYAFTVFGNKPAQGRSLFISLHGGGNADPSVNDEQWENQKTLYQPSEGIYLCPRAPTDTWNLWHEAHIDPMFERLITNLIVLEEVNPDRVYVMGYSAGGDGVYQLGPRMADHWAAASAMAGHPNDAQPYSLRNIGFTIHVGALDTSYDRNLVAQQWSDQLDKLESEDPGGYPHVVQIHAGKSHWMDLEDAVAVPWMAGFTRNPAPNTVVWYQDDVVHNRFYWLAVESTQAKQKTKVRATVEGQRIALESSEVSNMIVRLSDSMLDLDQPLSISTNGSERWSGSASRTIAILAKTLEERGDPHQVFSAEVAIKF